MDQIECLIKGLKVLSQYEGCEVGADENIVFAGPEDHRVVDASDAHALENLGWYPTIKWGWAFNL